MLNARILIVDDQPAHVRMLERLLRDAGYTQVSSTLDPQQVCAMHHDNPFDLILLDLLMPVLDGFGVMEGLRANTDDTCLPVIVLTTQPVHKLRALQAGARDFINKPFDVLEVQIRIRHMLEVRLLYKLLDAHNRDLERAVQERTAELRDSETRFRNLTAQDGGRCPGLPATSWPGPATAPLARRACGQGPSPRPPRPNQRSSSAAA